MTDQTKRREPELSEEMKNNMTNSSKHYVANFKKFVKEMSEIK